MIAANVSMHLNITFTSFLNHCFIIYSSLSFLSDVGHFVAVILLCMTPSHRQCGVEADEINRLSLKIKIGNSLFPACQMLIF